MRAFKVIDMKRKIVPIMTFLFFYLVGVVTGVFYVQRVIPSVATIKTIGVGVYKDTDCTIPLTEIDWVKRSGRKNRSADE